MEFAPEIQFYIPGWIPVIGGTGVTETVTTTWIIMGVLIVFSYISTRKFQDVPGPLQNFIEMFVESIENLAKTTMGEDN